MYPELAKVIAVAAVVAVAVVALGPVAHVQAAQVLRAEGDEEEEDAERGRGDVLAHLADQGLASIGRLPACGLQPHPTVLPSQVDPHEEVQDPCHDVGDGEKKGLLLEVEEVVLRVLPRGRQTFEGTTG